MRGVYSGRAEEKSLALAHLLELTVEIKHYSPPHTPHNMRGKASPIGGVSNAPQAPAQGKPGLSQSAEVPQDQMAAAIGAPKRETT